MPVATCHVAKPCLEHVPYLAAILWYEARSSPSWASCKSSYFNGCVYTSSWSYSCSGGWLLMLEHIKQNFWPESPLLDHTCLWAAPSHSIILKSKKMVTSPVELFMVNPTFELASGQQKMLVRMVVIIWLIPPLTVDTNELRSTANVSQESSWCMWVPKASMVA